LDAETLANFDVYGVITLHLTKEGVASLSRLLTCSIPELQEAIDAAGVSKKYVYYITGAVGSGKTSVIQRLKSLSTVSEWTEPRPAVLQKTHSTLNNEERQMVDQWVSKQFRRKNFRLRYSDDFLVVCDRTPLDPLIFCEPNEMALRANTHLLEIQPNPKSERLLPGHIIFLTASAEELMARAKERLKGASLEYLRNQQDLYRQLFDDANGAVTELSTSSRTAASVVRAVCKIIHLGDFHEYDVASKLDQLAGKSKSNE
jgi:deoxyadenosine/deoxycytidine kinase